MANIIIGVNVDLRDRRVQCVPEPAIVSENDTVQWGSFHGDVTVRFGSSSPFPKPDWQAQRGKLSEAARVTTGNAGKHQCTVTVITDEGKVEGQSQIVNPGSEPR